MLMLTCIGRYCGVCGTLHPVIRLTLVLVPTRLKVVNLNTLLAHRWISSKSIVKPPEGGWQSVVGLEIHAQINSQSKLFSGAGTSYGASTNSQVAFFDAALPGTLPVLNQRCVEAGVLTSLALGCHVNTVSKFDRKHYFYADMPAGYQITQQRQPLAVDGHMTYVYQCSRTSRVERRWARLVQLQLEQDSGKSLHDPDQELSLIDLNRAGMGLMEIVTAPDFTDGDDAASFVRDLRDVLLSVGTCDGKMAEGSLRVDANISVHQPGQSLGVRSEVKNLNSFRSLRLAIDYEIERQIQLLQHGGQVFNETRSFDLESGETVAMRDKEKLLDYRFMPEPNLPPLVIHTTRPVTAPASEGRSSRGVSQDGGEEELCVVLSELRDQLGELPDQTRHRLETQYGQTLHNAVILVRSGLSSLFESLVLQYSINPRAASYVVRNCVSPLLDSHKLTWSHCPVREGPIAEVTKLYQDDTISGASLMQLLEFLMCEPERSVLSVVEELQLWKTTDTTLILNVVDDVLSRNPKMIKAYKKGKVNQLPILAGKVVRKLDNKVDTRTVQDLIKDRLQ